MSTTYHYTGIIAFWLLIIVAGTLATIYWIVPAMRWLDKKVLSRTYLYQWWQYVKIRNKFKRGEFKELQLLNRYIKFLKIKRFEYYIFHHKIHQLAREQYRLIGEREQIGKNDIWLPRQNYLQELIPASVEDATFNF